MLADVCVHSIIRRFGLPTMETYMCFPELCQDHGCRRTENQLTGKVVRIKAGATDFDSYYCNLEELSGGKSFLRCWHITGDYFLLQMYTGEINSRGTGATRMAVFKATGNGDKGELYYVDGLPEPDRISSFSGTPFCENGVAYVGVIPITADGETNHPAIYKIDPVTHTATKGLTVNATGITAIGRLAKDSHSTYVVSATVTSANSTANYLLATSTLESGSVTPGNNNGFETATGTAWIFYKDQYLYRLQYNQGNEGVTTAYELNTNGGIAKRSNEYTITRFTTYGIFGENIISSSPVDATFTD